MQPGCKVLFLFNRHTAMRPMTYLLLENEFVGALTPIPGLRRVAVDAAAVDAIAPHDGVDGGGRGDARDDRRAHRSDSRRDVTASRRGTDSDVEELLLPCLAPPRGSDPGLWALPQTPTFARRVMLCMTSIVLRLPHDFEVQLLAVVSANRECELALPPRSLQVRSCSRRLRCKRRCCKRLC